MKIDPPARGRDAEALRGLTRMSAAEVLMWIARGSMECMEFATRDPGLTVIWIETNPPPSGHGHAKSIDDAIQELERALIGGRLKCHGRIGGSTIEIAPVEWAHLIILYGQNAARRSDDGLIEELVFLTPGVLALWPPQASSLPKPRRPTDAEIDEWVKDMGWTGDTLPGRDELRALGKKRFAWFVDDDARETRARHRSEDAKKGGAGRHKDRPAFNMDVAS